MRSTTLALLPLLMGGLVSCQADPRSAAPQTTLDPALFDQESVKPDVSTAYATVDGLDLPMAIWLPKDRTSTAERRGVLISIHGGAWSGYKGGTDVATWDGGGFAAQARYAAARGLVGVTITYRNVARPTKEPEAFEKGPSVFDLLADCRAAVRFLRANADRFGIDPRRIAVLGDSAGGQLVAALGTIDRYDHPGADTTISGKADLVVACNPITDFLDPAWLPFVPATPRAWEGDKPLSREDRAKLISPLWQASAASAPTLTIHGRKDGTVKLRHAEDFHARLQSVGVTSELSLLPNGTHAFVLLGYRDPGGQFIDVMTTVDRFLVHQGFAQVGVAFAGPALHGTIASVPGTATLVPSTDPALKPPVATVAEGDDGAGGKALQITKGSGGLRLTGHGNLGTLGGVSLRVRPEQTAGVIVRRGTGANAAPATGYLLSFGPKGVLTFKAAGATITGPVLPAKTWSTVSAQVERERITLTVDGKPAGEAPVDPAVLIGNHVVVGEQFAGQVADLRFTDDPAAKP